MTFKPILWSYEPRKDGSCSVKIYGKGAYFNTEITVDPQFWDKKAGKILRGHPLHAQMNAVIQAKVLELEKALLEGKELPTKKNLKAKVEQSEKVSICKFIQVYIDETAKGEHELSPDTIKQYKSLQLRLSQFEHHQGKPLKWEDINQAWYGDFWQFLHSTFNIQKAGGFSKHIKMLKKFMSEAQRRGIHDNNAHREPNFKVYKSKGQKIYLTEQEVEKMEQLDLSGMPWMEIERDRWLMCYYFLMRYQDGQDHIDRGNFFESGSQTFFRYEAKKTGINATIPVKPKALELLEKYGYKLPKTTNQEANRKIKMIASMAGINTPVTQNGVQGPKCNFVQTHTARRSAATNLATAGVPLDFIAKLGGWKKLETLQIYLVAQGLDVAKISSNYKFFQ
jgi:site-specific recombinase XerD